MRRAALLMSLILFPACWGRGGGVLPCLCASALVGTAVVSATAPPPPPVQEAPPPRVGVVWQPGYWVSQDGRWVWSPGRWVAAQPGYGWQPTHWERMPDGTWQQIPGRWVPVY